MICCYWSGQIVDKTICGQWTWIPSFMFVFFLIFKKYCSDPIILNCFHFNNTEKHPIEDMWMIYMMSVYDERVCAWLESFQIESQWWWSDKQLKWSFKTGYHHYFHQIYFTKFNDQEQGTQLDRKMNSALSISNHFTEIQMCSKTLAGWRVTGNLCQNQRYESGQIRTTLFWHISHI